ncbi:hypothetical protein Bca101_074660 [Brassica carinata]
MGKGTPQSSGGTCGLRLVVYSFLGEHGSTNMGALVSDVWNGISWDMHPARSEKQVRLMAFISLMSPQDRADSASWIMDGKVDKAEELDGGGGNKTVVWLEEVGVLMVTGLRRRRKKTIMTSRLS